MNSTTEEKKIKLNGLDDDDDDDDNKSKWSPIILVCKNKLGETAEISSIPIEVIALSGVLSSMRSFDATTSRVEVNVSPVALELVLRFSRMVVRHNQQVTDPNRKLPLTFYPSQDSKSIHNDHENRARQLPVILGGDVALGHFLDLFVEQPNVLLECHEAAKALLLEPACKAFELKWIYCLHGLSVKFMEAAWPTDAQGNVDERQHMIELQRMLLITEKLEFCPKRIFESAPVIESDKDEKKTTEVQQSKQQVSKLATGLLQTADIRSDKIILPKTKAMNLGKGGKGMGNGKRKRISMKANCNKTLNENEHMQLWRKLVVPHTQDIIEKLTFDEIFAIL